MVIQKYLKKYEMRKLVLYYFCTCKNTFLRLIYGAGSMEKYFLMKDKYENKSSRAVNGLQRVTWNKVRKYGRLVTSKAWYKEKENEENMLRANIIQGRQDFTSEYEQEIAYCKSKGKCMLYPYAFTEKYLARQDDIQVYTESADKNSLKYVIHNDKKLYFPNQGDDTIKRQYTQLIMEQDELSPHAYFDRKLHHLPEGGIFVDVGSAEGIISLEVADRASEIYLIESSKSWIRALEATFKDYKDKVHIINKCVGNNNSKMFIKLDDILSHYKNRKIFIKMDIEGMEIEGLKGCVETMKNNDCIFACAAYHTNTMEERLLSFFKENGYKAQVSNGYMLFIYGHMTLQNGMYERMEYPYFRHGLVKAAK